MSTAVRGDEDLTSGLRTPGEVDPPQRGFLPSSETVTGSAIPLADHWLNHCARRSKPHDRLEMPSGFTRPLRRCPAPGTMVGSSSA